MYLFIYVLIVVLFGLSSPAHAYLDPNSGTGLVAFLVAILAGLAFYGKKIFYAIKNKTKK